MKTISEIPFTDLPQLTKDEKREIFTKRQGWTLPLLANVAEISASVLSRHLRNKTMPTISHAKLVAFGMPAELLPEPKDNKSGPKCRTPLRD